MGAPKAAPAAHPSYEAMIAAAIKAIKDRKGASSQAIAKYIGTTYSLPDGYKKRMTLMLKKLTESGKLSKDEKAPRYKLGEALKKTPAKKKVPPEKKPAAKKPVKKPAKKPAVKKAPTKKKAAPK